MKIVSLLILLMLSGCVDQIGISGSQSATVVADSSGFGTLSDASDVVDMAAGPVYTRLAIYRHTATRQLRHGLITVDEAIRVQANADNVRQVLDNGVRHKIIGQISYAASLLDKYQGLK